MIPLRDFRNMLYETTDPDKKKDFRSARRRDGSITIKVKSDKDGTSIEEKHILGPYRLSFRKALLKQLLENQRLINETNPGDPYQLITHAELEQIRIEWRQDPNEPDWNDSVPRIYLEAMGQDVSWAITDDFIYSADEAKLIETLCGDHELPRELFMKLMELEVSYEGYVRRSNLQAQLHDLLTRDWSGEEAAIENMTKKKRVRASSDFDERAWMKRYDELGKVYGDAV